MSTKTNLAPPKTGVDALHQNRIPLSVEEQREATRRILDRVKLAKGVPSISDIEDEPQKQPVRTKSVRSRGLFWLSQLGAFAEAMVKGRYSKPMAIRAYEMVQSISI